MPISYITLVLMKILKERKKKTVISKEKFSKIITEFLVESPLSEEMRESLKEDFDLDYELEVFLDNYANYVGMEGNNIILSPGLDIDALDNLIEDASFDYDENLIDIINDFFEFNVPVFEMLGIKIEKELYDSIMELEKEIELGYFELARIEMCSDEVPNSVMLTLKKNIIKRTIILEQLKHSLSLEEYNDFYMYSMYMADLLGIDTITFKIENEDLETTVETDPFHRALFFVDECRKFAFAEAFYMDNKNITDEEKTKEMFFVKALDIVSGRINKQEYDDLNDDLMLAKYRLMYVIDMLYHRPGRYDEYLFMGNRKEKEEFEEDYSFIEAEVFYLIDEIFEYTDEELVNDISIDYENTIKAILIEAYYDLTGDKRVIEAIKNNPNYRKQHFVTGLFDSLMKKSKNKTKKREKE